jgi:hypothetical protein
MQKLRAHYDNLKMARDAGRGLLDSFAFNDPDVAVILPIPPITFHRCPRIVSPHGCRYLPAL